ncbi:polysaccharide deacetylase family protein [Jeotgalibacillus marinus]|uniref:Polysaccharide deacetylase family protein n=1 Tax=Jeotgalibacillus marinus TaxID=86667 RepID=A0ABV3Q6K9_9BACL
MRRKPKKRRPNTRFYILIASITFIALISGLLNTFFSQARAEKDLSELTEIATVTNNEEIKTTSSQEIILEEEGEEEGIEIKSATPQEDGDEKVAYITIDDGPSAYTESFLELFDLYNVKATFFMIDGNMKKHPNAVNKMLNEGHGIGLHSVSHDAKKIYASLNNVIDEMDEERKTLQALTGSDTTLIRTPYGSKPHLNDEWTASIQKLGYQIWDWNVDSEDWKNRDRRMVKTVIQEVRALELVEKEPVILFHDTKATLEHIEDVIVFLLDEGYELRAIDESISPLTW